MINIEKGDELYGFDARKQRVFNAANTDELGKILSGVNSSETFGFNAKKKRIKDRTNEKAIFKKLEEISLIHKQETDKQHRREDDDPEVFDEEALFEQIVGMPGLRAFHIESLPGFYLGEYSSKALLGSTYSKLKGEAIQAKYKEVNNKLTEVRSDDLYAIISSISDFGYSVRREDRIRERKNIPGFTSIYNDWLELAEYELSIDYLELLRVTGAKREQLEATDLEELIYNHPKDVLYVDRKGIPIFSIILSHHKALLGRDISRLYQAKLREKGNRIVSDDLYDVMGYISDSISPGKRKVIPGYEQIHTHRLKLRKEENADLFKTVKTEEYVPMCFLELIDGEDIEIRKRKKERAHTDPWIDDDYAEGLLFIEKIKDNINSSSQKTQDTIEERYEYREQVINTENAKQEIMNLFPHHDNLYPIQKIPLIILGFIFSLDNTSTSGDRRKAYQGLGWTRYKSYTKEEQKEGALLLQKILKEGNLSTKAQEIINQKIEQRII